MSHAPYAHDIVSLPGDEDFIRLPGLFRRWELSEVVDLGADFHLEDAGEAADGTQLIAVYRRERKARSTPSTTNTDTDTDTKEKHQ